MKALVTGANGFTGSHLVKALQQRGDSVVGLVRETSDLTRLKDTEIQLVTGEITDSKALRQAMKDVDTVFHTAAFVELGLVDAAKMERVNVEGTQAVLEIAKEMEISKMVYCSTIGIYGDTKGKVVDEAFERTQEDFTDLAKMMSVWVCERACSQQDVCFLQDGNSLLPILLFDRHKKIDTFTA